MENNIILKKAEAYELELVKRFYRAHNMRPQAARSDDVYVALKENKIIAALRLCSYDGDWLLRSMCVAQNNRNKGLGSYMLAQLNYVLTEKNCYCFPFDHLGAFYQRAGFVEIAVDDAPAMIADRFRAYRDKGKKIRLMKITG